MVTVGISLPVFAQQFQVSNETAVWAITSSLIGYVVGSFSDSRLSDIFGRRIALYLSVGFFSVGSILSATSINIGALIFWRFIIGMGIGAEIANVVTYVGELSPAPRRGFYSAVCIAMGMLGFAVVPFVGLALVPHYAWGWRLLYVIGGGAGVIIFFMRFYTPESLRWLLTHRRYEEAVLELEKMEQLVESRMGTVLPPVVAIQTFEEPEEVGIQRLKEPQVWRSLILFAWVWIFYYIGNYAWLTLDTRLFMMAGYQLHSSLWLVSLSSLGFLLGAVAAVGSGDRFERKWLCIGILVVWALVLALIAYAPHFYLILFLGFVAAMTIGSLIPFLYVFTAEHFPTPIRATCMSITDGLGHIGGAFCGQFTFAFYYLFSPSGHGFEASFLALSATGLLTAALLFLATPMTQHSLRQ